MFDFTNNRILNSLLVCLLRGVEVYLLLGKKNEKKLFKGQMKRLKHHFGE